MRQHIRTLTNAAIKQADRPPESVAQLAAMDITNSDLHIITRGRTMKSFTFAILSLLSATVPLSAITVTTPSNGAQLQSPFNLVASTATCGSKHATTMGYSVDFGPTTFVPTSFNAMVSATPGSHILRVKCWGSKVHDHKLLSITVTSGTTTGPVATSPSFSPAAGTYSAAQSVTLSSSTPGATIYYSTDPSVPASSWQAYSAAIPVGSSTVIYAIAQAPGYTQSGVTTGSFTISTATGPGGPQLPPDAISVEQIQLQPKWKMNHDPGTIGNSHGTMTIVSDPSLSGQAAKFTTTFEDWGGEIYAKSWGKDPDATNFLYDNYVWIEAGSIIGNLEMDNNQVMSNGWTVIYAFQCAGDHGTWDYSENAGTPERPNVNWVHSDQYCNPAKWTPNMWHHVQISYSRDDGGNVTFKSVWLDGVEQPINKTVNSAFALGWAKGDLMTNFQVDGRAGSGGSILYADNLTISRW
jgi:hypothetical protein